MSAESEKTKRQIITALSHPEAEEGLYFNNFQTLHEEDERIVVEASELEILDALRELIAEGKVVTDESGTEVVFLLKRN